MATGYPLEACIGSLRSLSADGCDYEHECSNDSDPKQCSVADQETCLGCAHSELVILHTAITILRTSGRLALERAGELTKVLQSTFEPSLRLDLRATHEYEDDGIISDETRRGELEIINQRCIVRDELLAIAEASV